MPNIWSDDYLNRLLNDGERDVAMRIRSVFVRFSITVTLGTRGATLPDYVTDIIQVTWKGKKLIPLYQSEMIEKSSIYRTEQGTPRYYLYSNEGIRNIKFYPVPNETILSDDTNIYGSDIANRIIVSAYRVPDTDKATFDIPDYIARRTVKAYVLWRAFSAEGKGQNLKASQYYKEKYEVLIGLYKGVKESLTDAKEQFDDLQRDRRTPPKPRLAPDFVVTP